VVGAEDDARGALTLVTALMQMELVDLVPCPAGSSRDLIFAERRLDELHGRLTADLFTVVNGHWTDDPGTVERLVRSACSVVDAVAMRDGEPGDLAAKRREIMEGLEQVALHLLRASPRRAYREALVPASQRRLAASQAVREAAALVRLGRADEARARCRTALELDPGGPGGEEIRGLARRLLDQLIGMGS
jgi:hypothetical protein